MIRMKDPGTLVSWSEFITSYIGLTECHYSQYLQWLGWRVPWRLCPIPISNAHWKRHSGDYVPLLFWNMKTGNDSLHTDSSHVPFKFSRRRRCRICVKVHPDHCTCILLIMFTRLYRSNLIHLINVPSRRINGTEILTNDSKTGSEIQRMTYHCLRKIW